MRGPAMWSRCWASADSAISACNTRRRWVSRRLASRAERTRNRWRGNWARIDYIDSQAQDPAAELQKLGGAKVILATVTNGDAMSAVAGRFGCQWDAVVIGAAIAAGLAVAADLRRRSVKGWYSGTAIDSQDTLAFSVLSGVRSMNEVFPLEKVAEAYERMMSGKARFRVVLTMGN